MSGAKADPHYEMRANRARTKAIVLSSLLHGPVATKHALHAYFYDCSEVKKVGKYRWTGSKALLTHNT